MAGYWRKRGKNSYRLEYTKDGDAHFKTIKVLGKNSREVEKVVEQELTKFILSIDSGSYINAPKKSFDKYAEDWLNLIQNDIAITTWENYERQLINHIIPYFAKKQIDKITAINVKQFYKHLLTNDVRLDGKKGPLSSRSVKDIHGILNKMFTDAKEWELLEKNIMENVKPPAVLKNEAKIYENDKDILDMIVALLKEPLQKQILFLTAMSASMRRGELVGINFNNVFFDKNEIKICQSAANTKEGPIIKSTKNKRTRIVAIPPILTEMYQQLLKERKELKLMLGENWEGTSDIDRSAVFIQKNGKRMYPSSPTQIWNKFLKKHKLKKITLHQLRHTSASVMLHEEIDIQTVASILGHSRASTTAEIYLHLFGNGKAAAANIFENKIQNAKKLG